MNKIKASKTAIFICDVQSKMGAAVYAFDAVVGTAIKLLKMAELFRIPVVLTEQHPKGLGPTAPDLLQAVERLGPLHHGTFEKKQFGMMIPPIESLVKSNDWQYVILCGVEAHICIVQTALDLMDLGVNVAVVADGVSSCNRKEIDVVMAELRQRGVTVATSESIGFRLLGDAAAPEFKAFSNIIKEEKEATSKRLDQLLSHTT